MSRVALLVPRVWAGGARWVADAPGVRAWLLEVFLPFAVTRLGLALAAHGALAIRPVAAGLTFGSWADVSRIPVVNAWSRWDGRWYLSVAQEGYHYTPGEWSNTAFSPLLPLLMKGGALLLRRDDPEAYIVAGLVASNVALLIAVTFLVAWMRDEFDPPTARRAAWCLLLFPTSFYLSAVYPHALFLACAVPAYLAARRGRWRVAGLLGAAGVLARPYGVLIAIALGYEYLAQRRFRLSAIHTNALWLGLIPSVYLLWTAYLGRVTGDPTSFARTSAAWNKVLTPQWQTLAEYVRQPVVLYGTRNGVLDLGLALFLLALVIRAWQVVPRSASFLASLLFAVATAWGTVAGVMRYSLEIFPLFAVLAVATGNIWMRRLYLLVAPAMGLVGMAGFAWGWDYFGY